MTDREQYTPGPASGAEIRKDGETKWTLILVRELRHSPEKVWQALTDPAQLREWAPFVTDGSMGAVVTVNLTWVGAPKSLETTVTRADAPKVLEYNDMRWELDAPLAAAHDSRFGIASIAASSQWALPDGIFVSMFWISF